MHPSVKVAQGPAGLFMRDYWCRGPILANSTSNLILLFVLAYALCATSYQIGSGASAPFPRQPPNETQSLPPLRVMFDWTMVPQFWHRFTRATFNLYCRFHVKQEPGGEKPVQDERRDGHGVTDREPVLEGTYTSYKDPSQRALNSSHALRTVDSIKLNEVHVPVQISALSKMLQKPLDGQVEVTDVQLEQMQQGDIDRDRSFEDPHPRSWMYNPMLRGSARNNRSDYFTESLTKGSYITTNSVQSNYTADSILDVSRKAMHHTKGFRPSLAHASEESRTSHMEQQMEQFTDVQMEYNSEYLDLRSEAKMRIPFGTQDLTYPRSSVSRISFGIQGKSNYNGTPVRYNDSAHPRSRVSGIPFGISFGILEIIDSFINFLHECCVMVPITSIHDSADNRDSHYNGTGHHSRQLLADRADPVKEQLEQIQSVLSLPVTTTTSMPKLTAVHHLHLFVNVLTCASVLAILAIVCHMYPGAPSGGSDATVKTPPSWGPEQERRYPFKKYTKDLLLWLMATDVPQERHCATIVLRLTGAAKELAEELSPQQLQHGGLIPAVDNFGNATTEQVNAVTFLMHQLNARFGPLDEEIRLKAVHEWNNFRRRPGESISATLTRFEQIQQRAEHDAGVIQPYETTAYKLLQVLGFNEKETIEYIKPFGYRMPNNRDEYNRMCLDIRRQLRLTEHQPGNIGSYLNGSHFFTDKFDPNATSSSYLNNALDEQPSFYQANPQQAGVPTTQSYFGEAESSMETSSNTSSDQGEEQLHDDNGMFTTEPIRLDDPAYGEKMYMAYSRTKKAWRRFAHKPIRRVRRFFKKRGKGRGKQLRH